jgi:SAM-dependent methyltransferase
LGTAVSAAGDDIIEGVLLCPEPTCQREHPIIDGIAVIVADLMGWASHQLDGVLRRDDLSPFTESLLADAAGPGTYFDRDRLNLSSYGRMHWGDLDTIRPLPREGSFRDLLETSLSLLDQEPRGVWADLGCATGRGTLELARRTGELAVGVDLSFSMLRVAERVRREGRAVFPVKRVGLVYDRCDLPVSDVPSGRMSFWCCDAAVLPFSDASFSGVLSLNLLDCVASPLAHLKEIGRVLPPGAAALLASPYDWSAAATHLTEWIGGHSQRAGSGGSSAAELRRILAPGAPAGVDTGLEIVAERDRVPWRVFSNERSSTLYESHVLRLERKPPP